MISVRSACRRWVPRMASTTPFSTTRTTPATTYEYVTVSRPTERVGLVTLNRPKALNALCDALFADLIHATAELDRDDAVGCLVVTGSAKAFAAGADIKEMKDRTFDEAYKKVRVGRLLLLLWFAFIVFV
jgi:enoyl-CoA hydratase/carnithine racemase